MNRDGMIFNTKTGRKKGLLMLFFLFATFSLFLPNPVFSPFTVSAGDGGAGGQDSIVLMGTGVSAIEDSTHYSLFSDKISIDLYKDYLNRQGNVVFSMAKCLFLDDVMIGSSVSNSQYTGVLTKGKIMGDELGFKNLGVNMGGGSDFGYLSWVANASNTRYRLLWQTSIVLIPGKDYFYVRIDIKNISFLPVLVSEMEGNYYHGINIFSEVRGTLGEGDFPRSFYNDVLFVNENFLSATTYLGWYSWNNEEIWPYYGLFDNDSRNGFVVAKVDGSTVADQIIIFHGNVHTFGVDDVYVDFTVNNASLNPSKTAYWVFAIKFLSLDEMTPTEAYYSLRYNYVADSSFFDEIDYFNVSSKVNSEVNGFVSLTGSLKGVVSVLSVIFLLAGLAGSGKYFVDKNDEKRFHKHFEGSHWRDYFGYRISKGLSTLPRNIIEESRILNISGSFEDISPNALPGSISASKTRELDTFQNVPFVVDMFGGVGDYEGVRSVISEKDYRSLLEWLSVNRELVKSVKLGDIAILVELLSSYPLPMSKKELVKKFNFVKSKTIYGRLSFLEELNLIEEKDVFIGEDLRNKAVVISLKGLELLKVLEFSISSSMS